METLVEMNLLFNSPVSSCCKNNELCGNLTFVVKKDWLLVLAFFPLSFVFAKIMFEWLYSWVQKSPPLTCVDLCMDLNDKVEALHSDVSEALSMLQAIDSRMQMLSEGSGNRPPQTPVMAPPQPPPLAPLGLLAPQAPPVPPPAPPQPPLFPIAGTPVARPGRSGVAGPPRMLITQADLIQTMRKLKRRNADNKFKKSSPRVKKTPKRCSSGNTECPN